MQYKYYIDKYVKSSEIDRILVLNIELYYKYYISSYMVKGVIK